MFIRCFFFYSTIYYIRTFIFIPDTHIFFIVGLFIVVNIRKYVVLFVRVFSRKLIKSFTRYSTDVHEYYIIIPIYEIINIQDRNPSARILIGQYNYIVSMCFYFNIILFHTPVSITTCTWTIRVRINTHNNIYSFLK